MRICLISCEIFFREFSDAIDRSSNDIEVRFLPKGLHDIGSDLMRERLQTEIDKVTSEQCDALAMGYGLCNNGLDGIRAGDVPLVLPRAHDCIALFFGSRQRYAEYFRKNPGTYFKTSGWIERADSEGELLQLSIPHRFGIDQEYAALVEKYGADNAEYLQSLFGDHTHNYSNLTYIEMGVEPDDRFEQISRRTAEEKGWSFKHEQGDMSLIKRLVDGDWDDADFLVVPPGRRIEVSYDDHIVRIGDEA